MHVLEKLFGSAARVKLLRLFLLSPEKVFTPKEAAKILKVNASPVSREKMLKFFKNKGKIKLLVLGGVFAGDFAQNVAENRLDLLIVGELRRGTVERFVKKIEAEVGKELNWTLLASAEFDHRLSMHDRMLRDLLDYPHEFLINKLGIE